VLACYQVSNSVCCRKSDQRCIHIEWCVYALKKISHNFVRFASQLVRGIDFPAELNKHVALLCCCFIGFQEHEHGKQFFPPPAAPPPVPTRRMVVVAKRSKCTRSPQSNIEFFSQDGMVAVSIAVARLAGCVSQQQQQQLPELLQYVPMQPHSRAALDHRDTYASLTPLSRLQ
jgi:hypothetical protein